VSLHEEDAVNVVAELKKHFKPHERVKALTPNLRDCDSFWGPIIKRNKYKIQKEVERNKDLTLKSKQTLIQQRHAEFDETVNYLKKLLAKWTHLPSVEKIMENLFEEITSTSPQAIKLSTIHRAKGLENDRVFILNYDKLPAYRPGMKDWEMEQEKNLKYVALTRPKKELFLVESQNEEKEKKKGSLFDRLPRV
jgi:superfamily I DNA/RNA helicase